MAHTDLELAVPHLDDAEELASVHVQVWRETYGGLLPERFYDDAARASRQMMWSDRLSQEPGRERVRIARQHGRIVGFAARGPAAEHLGIPPVRDEQLYALYVVASAHGRGVGRALLRQSLGGRPAQLWVAEHNPRAEAFYRRNGFARDGARWRHPRSGIVSVRMVR